MPLASPQAPSTAERVRSACVRARGAMLAVDGCSPVSTPLHHLLDDGSFAVSVPIGGMAARAAAERAVLELTDYAPVPLREPVRSLVWVQGRLQPVPRTDAGAVLDLIARSELNPAVLQVDQCAAESPAYALMRLEIESVVVADSTGAESVGLGALLAADPDPFCAMESCWLQHLDADHPEVIDRLTTKLPAPLRRGHVHALGIDRYGLCLRVEKDDGDHDVRLSFASPVDDVTGLSRAIRVLMGCPFLNGLRARKL